jgi:hypothetical protein
MLNAKSRDEIGELFWGEKWTWIATNQTRQAVYDFVAGFVMPPNLLNRSPQEKTLLNMIGHGYFQGTRDMITHEVASETIVLAHCPFYYQCAITGILNDLCTIFIDSVSAKKVELSKREDLDKYLTWYESQVSPFIEKSLEAVTLQASNENLPYEEQDISMLVLLALRAVTPSRPEETNVTDMVLDKIQRFQTLKVYTQALAMIVPQSFKPGSESKIRFGSLAPVIVPAPIVIKGDPIVIRKNVPDRSLTNDSLSERGKYYAPPKRDRKRTR